MGVSLSSQKGGSSAFCLATHSLARPLECRNPRDCLSPSGKNGIFYYGFHEKDFQSAPGLLAIFPFAVSVIVFIIARVTAKILAPLFVSHIVIVNNHLGSKWS